MIKVLQIGMTRNHGGLETYLLHQWRHLSSSRVHYDFVNITGEYPIVAQDELKRAGSKVFSVCSRHKNPIKHYWQWYKLLKQCGQAYKAIVLNTNSLEYIFPLFLSRFFNIPMRIIHSHNAGFERCLGIKRRLLISFNRKLMEWSVTDYFACSKKAGQWMFGDHQFFHVIHNAIDTETMVYNLEKRDVLRKKWGLENNFVIGHIGRFSYQKNHEFLIDIFAKIYQKNPSARLLLIGDAVDDDSFLRKTKEMVKTLDLENVVFFLGLRRDVPDLLLVMDAFLFPSLFEGLGLVGIEAQATGLPCFFSDTITRELGITQLAHFISLETPPEKWAEEILKESRISRKNMQQEIVEAGYDISQEIGKLEAFYEKTGKIK